MSWKSGARQVRRNTGHLREGHERFKWQQAIAPARQKPQGPALRSAAVGSVERAGAAAIMGSSRTSGSARSPADVVANKHGAEDVTDIHDADTQIGTSAGSPRYDYGSAEATRYPTDSAAERCAADEEIGTLKDEHLQRKLQTALGKGDNCSAGCSEEEQPGQTGTQAAEFHGWD